MLRQLDIVKPQRACYFRAELVDEYVGGCQQLFESLLSLWLVDIQDDAVNGLL